MGRSRRTLPEELLLLALDPTTGTTAQPQSLDLGLAGVIATNTTINIDLREHESVSIPGMILAGDADIGVLAGSDPTRLDGLAFDLFRPGGEGRHDRVAAVLADERPENRSAAAEALERTATPRAAAISAAISIALCSGLCSFLESSPSRS